MCKYKNEIELILISITFSNTHATWNIAPSSLGLVPTTALEHTSDWLQVCSCLFAACLVVLIWLLAISYHLVLVFFVHFICLLVTLRWSISGDHSVLSCKRFSLDMSVLPPVSCLNWYCFYSLGADLFCLGYHPSQRYTTNFLSKFITTSGSIVAYFHSLK